MSGPRPAASRWHGERGSSLVETLVAFLLMSVALGALASTLAFTARSVADSKSRQVGTAAFQAATEAARLLAFDTLALDAASSPPATFDPDGPGPLAPEPTVAVAGGLVVGAPFYAAGDGVVVETYVTEPSDAKGRRISVATTWNRPGSGPTTSYFGTIVVEASRGMAPSSFDVSPASLSGFSPTGRTICTPRTITNNGDVDNYDVVRPDVVGSPSVADYAFGAYLDLNRDGVADVSEFLTDVTGDANPDTASLGDDGRLGAGDSEQLLLCYDPVVAPSVQRSLDVHTEVRSSADPNIVVAIHDAVAVGDELRLHLHDSDNTQAHDRTLGGTFAMDVSPAEATTLFDYDANIDPADRPGLYLKKDEEDHAAVWEFQATTGLVLDELVDLDLWVASKEALAVTAPDVPDAKEVEVWVVVEVRSGSDLDKVGDLQFAYDHLTAGWVLQQVGVAIDDGGAEGVVLAAGDYLRLTVQCGKGDTDCHLAYDTTARPSSLTVGVQ